MKRRKNRGEGVKNEREGERERETPIRLELDWPLLT